MSPQTTLGFFLGALFRPQSRERGPHTGHDSRTKLVRERWEFGETGGAGIWGGVWKVGSYTVKELQKL